LLLQKAQTLPDGVNVRASHSVRVVINVVHRVLCE
jgi:hypothetical protein